MHNSFVWLEKTVLHLSREEHDRQKNCSEMSSSHDPCTFDSSPLLSLHIPTQMPTSTEGMGKRELKRMPSVTWKRNRSWKEREMGYEMCSWPSGRRRGGWRRSWRRLLVKRNEKANQTLTIKHFFNYFYLTKKTTTKPSSSIPDCKK